ncbi:hypothetical protein GTV32_18680 [Gordonia sp. SID5947]|uniref:hypothetical protein n=1 Tax=Gordonia sp. SID5947 TaxID=2690315 RepID=UPI00136C5BA3|nr:hypothetical protein [Gordonia sp. SID5947]MYR08195.1 hypothetical protein [Gordonia sp. SID5947]
MNAETTPGVPHRRPHKDTGGPGGTARRSAPHARFLTMMGLVGYATLLAAVVLVVLAIGAAAGDHADAHWYGLSAAVVVVCAAALLGTSRYLSARRPGDTRIQQDPLQPEVTVEEEHRYEELYRDDPDR